MNIFKKFSYYLIAPLISVFLIIFIYDFNIFKYDEALIFGYGDNSFGIKYRFADEKTQNQNQYNFSYFDDILSLAMVKLVVKEGMSYCSKNLGYPQIDTNCFSDYALNNNYLVYLIFYFLSFFTQSPFIIAYIYAILTFFLITLAANICLRKFTISKFNSALLAIFYSFNFNHLNYLLIFTIGNYFIVPFIILMSYWIFCDKINFFIFTKDAKLSLKIDKYILCSLLIIVVSMTMSAYYGYCCLCVLMFSLIINLIKKFKLTLAIFSQIFLTFLTLLIGILINLSTFIFWLKNGKSEIISRGLIQSVYHGFSIISMIVPIKNHPLESFSTITQNLLSGYNLSFGEKYIQQIGLLASLGFIFLLILPLRIATKHVNTSSYFGFIFTAKKYNILKFAALLNLVAIIFWAAESFYLILHYFFMQIRGVGRLNVFFIFLALIFWGLIFDEVVNKKIVFKNIFITKLVIIILMILALIDSCGLPKKLDNFFAENKKYYNDYKNFVEKIESSVPKQSKIFMLPIKGIPEYKYDDYKSMIGFFFAKELNFSYPVIKFRKSHKWQYEAFKSPFHDFIDKIKKENFVGVWIQRDIFDKIEFDYLDHDKFISQADKFLNQDLKQLESQLKKIAKNIIETDDQKLVFYEI